jgi:hypothetical protein
MSYLSNPTSKTEYGVVQVGDFINVLDGIISLEQDLGPNANVTFNNANVTNQLTTLNANVTNNLYAAGNLVLTAVTPNAGAGINISNVGTNGYTSFFTVTNTGVLSLANGAGISTSSSNGNITVTNTGVLSLTAGPGISLSGANGNITVSSTGADLISVIGVTGNYTATSTDEYIGVFSDKSVTILLPPGVNGRVYIIKDEYGRDSGKITIRPNGTEKIDNANTYIIDVPFQAVHCVFRAGTWRII